MTDEEFTSFSKPITDLMDTCAIIQANLHGLEVVLINKLAELEGGTPEQMLANKKQLFKRIAESKKFSFERLAYKIGDTNPEFGERLLKDVEPNDKDGKSG